MSTHLASLPVTRHLVRYFVGVLTVLAVLFVLQAGLVPFDFSGGLGPDEATRFFGVHVSRFTLPDIVSNIFLYVPIGILFHCCLCRLTGHRALAVPIAVVLAAALSAGIELLQAYSPSRVSSMIDLSSNVVGAALGAAVSWIAKWLVPRIAGGVVVTFHEQPGVALVKSYICLLIVFAALPFSFSFDTTGLKQCLKSATFVPFAGIASYEATADAAYKSGDAGEHAYARWASMKHWSRWAAEWASFAFLAWLLHSVLQGAYGFNRGAATALVCWTAGCLAIGLSLLQLPILTRGFDVTDILFRWVGVGTGLIVRSIHARETRVLSPAEQATRRQHRAGIACGAALLYILYTGAIPLVFDAETGGPTQAVTAESFLPFFAYFATRFDLMVDDVMEKFFSFVVFGALWVTARPRIQTLSIPSRILATAGVGVCLSVVIEIVQMYLPVRVTSLSDPIVAACGCALGVLAQEHAVCFYRLATSVEAVASEAAAREPEDRHGLAPADELVASLAQPRADAPKEPSPAPPRIPQR